VLGGEVVMEGEPSIVALANGINVGGPTGADGHARDAARSGSDAELNIRASDIEGSTPTGARRGPTS
jgi:hypothetical protein